MPAITDDAPVLVLTGTNRPDSNAHRVAGRLLHHYAEAGVPHAGLSLADLPASALDPGVYAEKPPEIEALTKRVLECAGLHVVTPEYNGSFPGVLKLFIDMLPFPESFERKPTAFVGEAAGMWGGLRPVEQLAQIFSYRDAHLFPPRVFMPRVNDLIADDGTFDEKIDARLREQCDGFAAFIATLAD